MGRRKGGVPVHGWVVLDKPPGMSSAQAVAAVRRLTGAAKAGHGGTLDPLATGILPIALGEATKTVSWAMNGRKTYAFRVRWGEVRSTDDAEGEITGTSPVRPDGVQIRAVLPRFTGTVLQVPPAFSAIKVAGKRAYALARNGDAVSLAPRPIEILRLVHIGSPDADHADFEAEVGKGAYIRALARDIACALGTLGSIVSLRRLAVGRFTLDMAISLDNVASLGHSPAASIQLLPVETALDDIPVLALTEDEARRLAQGQPVMPVQADERERLFQLSPGAVVQARNGTRLVALAQAAADGLRPVRVINI